MSKTFKALGVRGDLIRGIEEQKVSVPSGSHESEQTGVT